MAYEPFAKLPGGFSNNDGTIAFYSRVNALIEPDMTILDLGAGRGAWFEDDQVSFRREVRLLKGKAKKVYATDIDQAVLENRSADECIIQNMQNIPMPNNSVDLVIADFVLEHVNEPESFSAEIERVLKFGGWFCARTPHKFNYVSLAARFVSNSSHVAMLRKAQPERKAADVFPTAYKLNTLTDIRRWFENYQDFSFLIKCDPAYYFGTKLGFQCFSFLHTILPKSMAGNIFVFLKKTQESDLQKRASPLPV